MEEVEERGGGDGGEHHGHAVEESPDISIHFEILYLRGMERYGCIDWMVGTGEERSNLG